jgi:hypothetical protein
MPSALHELRQISARETCQCSQADSRAKVMLNPDSRFCSLVSLAMAGEKQMGQLLNAMPVRNAKAICAGVQRTKVRTMQMRGAAMKQNSRSFSNPNRLARIVVGMVPTTLPSVSVPVRIPRIFSLK